MTQYCIVDKTSNLVVNIVDIPDTTDILVNPAQRIAAYDAAIAAWEAFVAVEIPNTDPKQYTTRGERPTIKAFWQLPPNTKTAPAGGAIGQLWDGTNYSEPVKTYTKKELSDAAASIRQKLTGGKAVIPISAERAIPVWVDQESRTNVTGLVVASQIVPGLTTEWKGSDGLGYTLVAGEMAALALGILNFVNTCFAAERAVLDAIDSGTITTIEQVASASWPVGG